jgi:hypothetical protein
VPQTFYIYVDGYDLEEIAPVLRLRIESFAARYGVRVQVVDRREETEADSLDLPAWDLGVNFEFKSLTPAEKKELALFFQGLSVEFSRDFVVGRTLSSGLPEDFVFILAAEPIAPVLELLAVDEERG